MTAWTTPTTWASGNVPTAAQLNTQIRDNLLHISETTNEFGYPYTIDPRIGGITSALGSAENTVYYILATGRGTITKIRVRVATAAGNVCVGAYTGTGAHDERIPDQIKGTSDALACPAAGIATISLLASTQIVTSDWFAIGYDTTAHASASLAHAGALGTAIGYLGRGQLAIEKTTFPLGLTANPSSLGLGANTYMIGVA